MSTTLVDVERDQQYELARVLVERAKTEGTGLVGPGGLLSDLTKNVLETALEAELDDHLGYPHGARDGKTSANERNGHRSKTVTTEAGPVTIGVPRDRDGTFEPVIVKKRQRRLGGVDQIVLSLTARGLTSGEVSAHLAEVYGASVSKETISRITDQVLEEMAEWQNRPLDRIYPVLFIDAIRVKVRDGQVANKPFYVAVGVTTTGHRDILGIWAGPAGGGEGAKYWLGILTEIKNRGVEDVLICCCDGLKGLPDAVNATWKDTLVQTCVVHLIRNTFRYASRKYWDQIAKDLRPIYQAKTVEAAGAALDRFAGNWEARYPAAVKLWHDAWEEFIPFLHWDVEIRKVISTTNTIESLNARYRRAVRARGHFPNDQAALKCLYLTTRALDPTGGGQARWVVRWKAALNAFAISFPGRFDPAEDN